MSVALAGQVFCFEALAFHFLPETLLFIFLPAENPASCLWFGRSDRLLLQGEHLFQFPAQKVLDFINNGGSGIFNSK